MSKVLVIAKREYHATVRTKAFIISLVLMPILMLGGIVAQRLLKGVVNIDDKKIVVIDGTGVLYPKLVEAARAYNEKEIFDDETHKQDESRIVLEPAPPGPINDELRLALSDRVRRHEIFGFVEIAGGILDTPKNLAGAIGKQLKSVVKQAVTGGPSVNEVFFCSENQTQMGLSRWFTRVVNTAAAEERLQRAHVDPKIVSYAVQRVTIEPMSLYTRTTGGEIKRAEKSQTEAAIFVPMTVMMLMFMAIMVSAQPLLNSVLEEKQQRIAEVLLGSASPFQIMMGKLLGNVAVSVTIVAIYFVGGFFVLRHYHMTEVLPAHIIPWFIAFQILAVLLFGSVFVAVGAACTEIKEAQSYMTPIMLLLVLPMMVWFNILREPLSKFATAISFFPPCTPMIMVMRMAATRTLPMWQPIVGIGVVLITVVICVWAAGRVFRIGLLAQGKAPKPSELIRWIISG